MKKRLWAIVLALIVVFSGILPTMPAEAAETISVTTNSIYQEQSKLAQYIKNNGVYRNGSYGLENGDTIQIHDDNSDTTLSVLYVPATNSVVFGYGLYIEMDNAYTQFAYSLGYDLDTKQYSTYGVSYESMLGGSKWISKAEANVNVATVTKDTVLNPYITESAGVQQADDLALQLASSITYLDSWKKIVDNTGVTTFAKLGFLAADPEHATKAEPSNPSGFTDVSTSAYYYQAVIWAKQQGITSGTSATTFSPDAPCTRGQMAQFLYNLSGQPSVSGDLPFRDVSDSAYYRNAVIWAKQAGITSGTSTSTFSPDDTCTRGQMAQFLYNLKGQPLVSGDMPFTDVPRNAFYRNAVIWAKQASITSGTSTSTFSPDDPCTRGQMVTFLYNYSNQKSEPKDDEYKNDDTNKINTIVSDGITVEYPTYIRGENGIIRVTGVKVQDDNTYAPNTFSYKIAITYNCEEIYPQKYISDPIAMIYVTCYDKDGFPIWKTGTGTKTVGPHDGLLAGASGTTKIVLSATQD